jgi:hypothetical protein
VSNPRIREMTFDDCHRVEPCEVDGVVVSDVRYVRAAVGSGVG